MRWKIQLYRIIYAHALENTVIYIFMHMRWYFKKICIKYSNIALLTIMRLYLIKYCIKYSNIALFTPMRWKIQLYSIIYAHALEIQLYRSMYAHAWYFNKILHKIQ
jgi:hypothetical protein